MNIQNFSFMQVHLKIPSGKWRPFYLGLNMLTKRLANRWALPRDREVVRYAKTKKCKSPMRTTSIKLTIKYQRRVIHARQQPKWPTRAISWMNGKPSYFPTKLFWECKSWIGVCVCMCVHVYVSLVYSPNLEQWRDRRCVSMKLTQMVYVESTGTKPQPNKTRLHTWHISIPRPYLPILCLPPSVSMVTQKHWPNCPIFSTHIGSHTPSEALPFQVYGWKIKVTGSAGCKFVLVGFWLKFGFFEIQNFWFFCGFRFYWCMCHDFKCIRYIVPKFGPNMV